jgi:pyruvate dehydrogenase E1 component alpha subunit
MDVHAVLAAAEKAGSYVREGNGPYFLEVITYRFRAHSMYDPDLYRDKAEIERWRQRDPIPALRARLQRDALLDAAAWNALCASVEEEVAAAVAFAEAGTLEPVADLLKDVYTPAGAP